VEKAGGTALPIKCDLRSEQDIDSAITKIIEKFGGIDIVVNNASAISLTRVEQTSAKKYDLMHQINGRGSFLLTQKALPHLKKSTKNPHVLFLSPPPVMNADWFKGHVAYTASKMLMSMWVLGMARDFKEYV
jgi:citronellol/citronellal dehydrogenase